MTDTITVKSKNANFLAFLIMAIVILVCIFCVLFNDAVKNMHEVACQNVGGLLVNNHDHFQCIDPKSIRNIKYAIF